MRSRFRWSVNELFESLPTVTRTCPWSFGKRTGTTRVSRRSRRLLRELLASPSTSSPSRSRPYQGPVVGASGSARPLRESLDEPVGYSASSSRVRQRTLRVASEPAEDLSLELREAHSHSDGQLRHVHFVYEPGTGIRDTSLSCDHWSGTVARGT